MTPSFLTELAALAVVAALVAYVAQRAAGLVPLVGFLLAGVMIGPNALGLVHDPEMVEGAAEVGVILLLFTIGIEFSLERLARIRRLILGGGTLQVVLTVGAVAFIARAFGVGWSAAIFTGFLAALSSTVIVLKLLADRSETGTTRGQASLGILLFQDLAVIVMVLLVPVLGGAAGGLSATVRALGKAAIIIALVIVVARRVMPAFLERVARTCSPDIFLLTIIAACFGTAWLCSLAGLSVSLGAFLAGLVVSESSFSEHALSEILPLRILFSAAFFVSIGMLLDPRFLIEHPFLIAGVVLGVFALKLATTGVSLLALGIKLPVAAASALMLAQIGEFAFVLERSGAAVGLYAAGSADLGGQCFIAATVLLMAVTPLWSTVGDRIETKLDGAAAARARKAERLAAGVDGAGLRGAVTGPASGATAGAGSLGGRAETAMGGEGESGPRATPPRDHIVIGGYGDSARQLVRALDAASVPYVILTLSPDGANAAEREGRRVVRGDYSRRQILEAAGIYDARLFVVADDDPAMTERVVAVARAINPDLEILAQTERPDERDTLRGVGANRVVAAQAAAARELTREALRSAGVTHELTEAILSDPGDAGALIQLNPVILAARRCEHVAGVRAVLPDSPDACSECVALGDEWVHLRLCMTCGHVACCDSSPNRHARAHAAASGHPIVRSWQPGEDWAWCFVDERML